MHQDHDKIQQAARDADNADSNGRREPRFATFDEDEDFEEPERDTDYATHYSDDEDLDEDFRLQEDVEEYLEDPDEDDLPRQHSDRGPDIETPAYAGRESAYSTERDFPDEEEDEWQEEPVHAELDDAPTQQWPLGLFIVGAVAILLLFAGGYGVIKQRAAMEEEIRQLQASLATAVGPEEIALSRTEIIELENRNSDLQARLDSLTLENSRLTDTVKDLQSQLQVRQDAVVKKAEAKPATPAPPPVKSEPVRPPAPKPAAKAPAATAAGSAAATGWFVNFGSYTQLDTAESWAARLKPPSGSVAVVTGSKDGKTFYRVRVVELDNRDQAESIARQLEQEHQLSRLWVGKQ